MPKPNKYAPAQDKPMPKTTTRWHQMLADEDGLLTEIVNHVSCGQGLCKFAKNNGVCFATLWQWIDREQSRRSAYEAALLAGATYLCEQALEILDAEPRKLENGQYDNAGVTWQRARADQRKWQASKMFPGRFGDRQIVDIHQDISIHAALQAARQRAGLTLEHEGNARPAPMEIGYSRQPEAFESVFTPEGDPHHE